MRHDLAVRVRTAALGDGRMGLWDEHTRTVWLDVDLTAAERRCTLAHELVHAERGDVPCHDAVLEARQERRVERLAALRLVPWSALAEAIRWSDHPDEVAALLDVDRATLDARIDALSAVDRDRLQATRSS